MSEKGKCAGGYELPGMGKPCKKCGATSREPCPEFARQQADEIASLRAQLAKAMDVERIARAIYETEPHFEPGEYVDGFAVSPGGNLTWDQALDRDAEFASDPIMGSITAFAYRAARAVVSYTDEQGKS